MKTVCNDDRCAGCMACVDICPKKAIMIDDALFAYNAVIEEKKCIKCGACYRVCQQLHPAKAVKPCEWYQGWAQNPVIRCNGASGGLAMAIAEEFMNSGGSVCSCVFEQGRFMFRFADEIGQLWKFAGSKYVKSNPGGIYHSIKTRINQGQRILFIGLPCQVSALKNFVGRENATQLYTIDLICHGTPSPDVLELFLTQHKLGLTKMQDIKFRDKYHFQISDGENRIAKKGVKDKYMMAFLNSLIYTESCYSCHYARLERVADLTLGDSWGTDLSDDEWNKGISMVLVQTDQGKKLLMDAKLTLKPLNLETAIKNNHQLNHASKKPAEWSVFFEKLKAGEKLDKLVYKNYPKQCLKQDIKQLFISIFNLRSYPR